MNSFKQWKACGRKKRYDTEAEAKEFAAQYQQRHYRCPTCGGWHLTGGISKMIGVIRSRGRLIT